MVGFTPVFGGLSLYSSQSATVTNHCRPRFVALSVPRRQARCNDSACLPDNSTNSCIVRCCCISVFYSVPNCCQFGIDRHADIVYTNIVTSGIELGTRKTIALLVFNRKIRFKPLLWCFSLFPMAMLLFRRDNPNKYHNSGCFFLVAREKN